MAGSTKFHGAMQNVGLSTVITDNLATALDIESTDGKDYIKVSTVDGSETLILCEDAGKVGIGVAPTLCAAKGLHIQTGDTAAASHTSADELVLEASGDCGMGIAMGASSVGSIYFSIPGVSNSGSIRYTADTTAMSFHTAGATARMTINAAGQTLASYGTTLLPGISFDGDPDLGFSRTGTNQISLSTNGAEIFRANASWVSTAKPLQVNTLGDTDNALNVTGPSGTNSNWTGRFVQTSGAAQGGLCTFEMSQGGYAIASAVPIIRCTNGNYSATSASIFHVGADGVSYFRGGLGTALSNTCTSSSTGNRTITSTSHGVAVGQAVLLSSAADGAREMFTVASVTDANVFVVDSDLTESISGEVGKTDGTIFSVKSGDNATFFSVDAAGKVAVPNLPTSNPGANYLWSNSGVITMGS